MSQIRKFLGEICLKRAPFVDKLRRSPLLGTFVHYISYKALPADFQLWRQIEGGTAKGVWIKVNPRTGRTICEGVAEPEIQKSIAHHLRPGMVFYDAGANIGLFTLAAARLVGETGKVFSFEPDAETAVRLRNNVSYNGFAWVSVIEAALWSRGGEISFAPADASVSPDHGTGRIGEIAGSHTVTVLATTLDDFCREHAAPDLLKCDVEGAEVELLRGATNLLRYHRPAIICELHSSQCEIGVYEILKQNSYCVRRLDENHLFAEAAAS